MKEFIVVNGEPVDLLEALRWSIVEDNPSFLEATRARVVISQYAKSAGLSAEKHEIQEALDKLRYALQIESAAETKRWMKNSQLTPAALESICRLFVLQEKVWQSIPETEIVDWLDKNRDDFTQVDLYGIKLKGRKLAYDIWARIHDGHANFHLEAMSHSVDETSARQGGYLGRLRREQTPEEIRISVFSVDPGEIIGPLKMEDGYSLFTITKIIKPELDDVRDEIRNLLFDRLIKKEMAKAVVFYPVFSR